MKITKFCAFAWLIFASNIGISQNNHVDFISADAVIHPDFNTKSLTGFVTYNFLVNKKVDTIYLDAQKLNIHQVKINDKKVPFVTSNKQIKVFKGYKKGNNKIEISYNANPKQTVYFVGDSLKHQIWTQGQGKYTSHWLPSFDDVNEKIIFNFSITYPENYTVVSNGKLQSTSLQNGLKTWRYKMDQPMSSYLAMFAIGDYVKFNKSTSNNTPLEFYLKSEDASNFDTTYSQSIKMFDFLEKEIGVNYPWGIYKQIPVDDFLYAGMENTTATIFSQDFVVDKVGFNDRNYLNVNAHELAHQWFGNLVTATESKHHWIQEGFATYYALLAEREVFGDNYFNFELYDMAEQILRAQKNDKEPILSAKASSLTFYKKGAWALHYLKNKIGDQNFKESVKNFVTKFQFKNAQTSDFLAEIKAVDASFDIQNYQKIWLEGSELPVNEVFEILNKNQQIVNYLEIGKMYNIPLSDKKEKFINILNSDAYINCKEEVIYQLGKEKTENLKPFFDIISKSSDIKLRQAFVRSLGKVTAEYKDFYTQFLNDESYVTREIVLKNLWSAFPNDRIALLAKTNNWIGFNDKNLRITWLTLALLTTDFNQNEKVNYYDELLKYSKVGYESNTRQYAITNLLYLNANDVNALKSLAQGLSHHKWQFVKFCKTKIREQIKQDKYMEYYKSIITDLDPENKLILQDILK